MGNHNFSGYKLVSMVLPSIELWVVSWAPDSTALGLRASTFCAWVRQFARNVEGLGCRLHIVTLRLSQKLSGCVFSQYRTLSGNVLHANPAAPTQLQSITHTGYSI